MIRFCATSIQSPRGELLEQAAIEAARRPVIDVLDGRLMAQAGEA